MLSMRAMSSSDCTAGVKSYFRSASASNGRNPAITRMRAPMPARRSATPSSTELTASHRAPSFSSTRETSAAPWP
jgi:hypothetical protein